MELSNCCDVEENPYPGFGGRCNRCGDYATFYRLGLHISHPNNFEPVGQIVRTTDPATSHQAAVKITDSGRRQSLTTLALEAVYDYPGLTAGGIGDITRLGYDKVWRRLSELKRPLYVKGILVRPARIYTQGTGLWHGTKQARLYPIQGQGVLL